MMYNSCRNREYGINKIIPVLSIFASIALSVSLAACAVQQPQVTVTSVATVTSPPSTATLIPTPTLPPQFIEVQEQVAASGERFTLLFDGTIEDTTTDGVTSVPGLKLDKNGTWQLSVGDQQVELKPADVSFDDDKGISIAGYTLGEDDKWMEIITPEKQLALDLDVLGMTSDKYNVGYDREGKIEMREKGTNKLIYWDGKWSSEVIVDMIEQAGICKPKEFKVDPNGIGNNEVVGEQLSEFRNYYWRLIVEKSSRTDEFKKVSPWPRFREDSSSYLGQFFNYDILPVPLKGTDQCWVFFTSPHEPRGPITFLTFETNDGQVVGMPVFQP